MKNKLIKRFKIEKTEKDYLIIDTDMDNIPESRIVAKCVYINSGIVCDALNIQYNLSEEDREKYSMIPKKLKNEKPRARNNKR